MISSIARPTVIALLGLIGGLVATIHFTIQVDVNPRFYAIELKINQLDRKIDQVDQKVDQVLQVLEKERHS